MKLALDTMIDDLKEERNATLLVVAELRKEILKLN